MGLFVEQGALDLNSWLLFLQYAACFGVELTINNVAAKYFAEEFDLSTSRAGLVASLFGLMNLFARSLGGIYSGELVLLRSCADATSDTVKCRSSTSPVRL